jgi:uncharacterized protein (TIGR03067 family)
MPVIVPFVVLRSANIMKTIFAISTCLILAVSLAAHAAKEPDDRKAADDQKALQGNWVPIKAELAGKPMPDAVVKTISLKLIKNEYEVLVAGKPDKGTWTIDPAAKPKGMKIVGVKGPNAGKTFPAIYELTPDTLRVCYDLSGAARPKEFKTAAGTKLYLVTYRRKKEAAETKPENKSAKTTPAKSS